MPNNNLSAQQQYFLDKYVRKGRNFLKAKGKLKRADDFGPRRVAAEHRLNALQQHPRFAEFQAEFDRIDALGEALKFNEAGRQMDALSTRMDQEQAAFMADGVAEGNRLLDGLKMPFAARQHSDLAQALAPGGLLEQQAAALALVPDAHLSPPSLQALASGNAARDWAGRLSNTIQRKRRALHIAKAKHAEFAKKLNDLKNASARAHTATTQIATLLASLDASWQPDADKAPLTALADRVTTVLAPASNAGLIDPSSPTIVPNPPRIAPQAEAQLAQLQIALDALEAQLGQIGARVANDLNAVIAAAPHDSPAYEGAVDALRLLEGAPALNVPVNAPRDFDTATFVAGSPTAARAQQPLRSNAEVAAHQQTVQQALLDHIQQQGWTADSDEVFDLSLKTAKDFYNEVCESMGWADPSDEQKVLAAATAQGMLRAARAVAGNRIEGAGSSREDIEKKSLTLGGQRYGNGRFLAEGGMGQVFSFEDLSDPSRKIVLKKPKSASDEKRQEMLREIKSHRQVTRQPQGTPGRENIVDFKGAILGDDGELYVAMEMVSGGDVEDNRLGAAVACDTGVMPEEARQALSQYTARQAIEGLRYMRDQNMTHFDIKGANIMVAEDGTVKIADFGSAAFGTDTQGHVPPEAMGGTTSGYEAPEISNNADKTHQFDTHSIGKVLQVLHSSEGSAEGDSGATGALKRLVDAMTNPDPALRPSLEGVLASSYMANLDNYDAAKLKELARLNAAYSKAVAKEGPAIYDAFMANELDQVGPLNFNPPDYKELISVSKETLRLREQQRQALVTEKEAAVEAGKKAVQAGDKAAEQACALRVAELDAELKTIQAQMAVLRGLPQRFGQSPAAKQIGDQIRALSQQLRP